MGQTGETESEMQVVFIFMKAAIVFLKAAALPGRRCPESKEPPVNDYAFLVPDDGTVWSRERVMHDGILVGHRLQGAEWAGGIEAYPVSKVAEAFSRLPPEPS